MNTTQAWTCTCVPPPTRHTDTTVRQGSTIRRPLRYKLRKCTSETTWRETGACQRVDLTPGRPHTPACPQSSPRRNGHLMQKCQRQTQRTAEKKRGQGGLQRLERAGRCRGGGRKGKHTKQNLVSGVRCSRELARGPPVTGIPCQWQCLANRDAPGGHIALQP
jgi:hypothetical protein